MKRRFYVCFDCFCIYRFGMAYTLEIAQRMAGHADAKTTSLYDRRNEDISVGEIERIGI